MNTETETALELIRNHPLTKQLETEQAAENLRQREQAAAGLAAARLEKADKLPPLYDKINKIEDELKKHDLTRTTIVERIGQARLEKAKESGRIHSTSSNR